MIAFTLRIPMIDAAGPLAPQQASREFQGVMPEHDAVNFIATIIRDGLESAHYPDFKNLIAYSDDYLVQQVNLAMAVPDDVWIRNGFYPLSDWQETGG
ncbi:MAG: hypothetical protein ABR585_13075 [Gemmatimonadaceae bacterium]